MKPATILAFAAGLVVGALAWPTWELTQDARRREKFYRPESRPRPA